MELFGAAPQHNAYRTVSALPSHRSGSADAHPPQGQPKPNPSRNNGSEHRCHVSVSRIVTDLHGRPRQSAPLLLPSVHNGVAQNKRTLDTWGRVPDAQLSRVHSAIVRTALCVASVSFASTDNDTDNDSDSDTDAESADNVFRCERVYNVGLGLHPLFIFTLLHPHLHLPFTLASYIRHLSVVFYRSHRTRYYVHCHPAH